MRVKRAAMRAMDDQRIAAKRKHQDALRAVLTPEQFQMMQARKAGRGQGRGVVGGGRRGGGLGAGVQGARGQGARLQGAGGQGARLQRAGGQGGGGQGAGLMGACPAGGAGQGGCLLGTGQGRPVGPPEQ